MKPDKFADVVVHGVENPCYDSMNGSREAVSPGAPPPAVGDASDTS